MTSVCSYQGCNLPVFVEPRTHIAHSFCGRTHAKLAGANLKVPELNSLIYSQ